jgi:hypothetical protein
MSGNNTMKLIIDLIADNNEHKYKGQWGRMIGFSAMVPDSHQDKLINFKLCLLKSNHLNAVDPWGLISLPSEVF